MEITTKEYASSTYYYVVDGVNKGETWTFAYSINNATAPTSAVLTIATDYEATPSLELAGTVTDSGDSYSVSYTASRAQTIALGVNKFLFSSKETFADGSYLKKVQGELQVRPSVEIEV